MKAVLDACVLYPTLLREILLDVAGAGLFAPVWSPRILAEWRHAAARLNADEDRAAGVEIAQACARFPAAMAADGGTALAGIDWPDPADRHVAEAARAAGAGTVVTANLRDFPRRALAAAGLEAAHPDAFLSALHDRDPGAVAGAVASATARAAARGAAPDARALLRRAGLSRLARRVAVNATNR